VVGINRLDFWVNYWIRNRVVWSYNRFRYTTSPRM